MTRRRAAVLAIAFALAAVWAGQTALAATPTLPPRAPIWWTCQLSERPDLAGLVLHFSGSADESASCAELVLVLDLPDGIAWEVTETSVPPVPAVLDDERCRRQDGASRIIAVVDGTETGLGDAICAGFEVGAPIATLEDIGWSVSSDDVQADGSTVVLPLDGNASATVPFAGPQSTVRIAGSFELGGRPTLVAMGCLMGDEWLLVGLTSVDDTIVTIRLDMDPDPTDEELTILSMVPAPRPTATGAEMVVDCTVGTNGEPTIALTLDGVPLEPSTDPGRTVFGYDGATLTALGSDTGFGTVTFTDVTVVRPWREGL